jgi:hypothetical protein
MYCQRCGIANVAHAVYCKSCAEPIVALAVPTASMPVPVVAQAMAATARLPLKSPGLAGLLSAVWPGAGQLYTGRAVGLAQMIFVPCGYAVLLFAAFFSLAMGQFLMAALLVLATLWGWMKVIEDAVGGAQRINAVRTHARATVRVARGAGYAPQPSGPTPAAVKYSSPSWAARIFGFAFVFLCTLALLAVIAVAVNL